MEGLGLVPGRVTAFDAAAGLPVPHIGWNDLLQRCAARPGAAPAGALACGRRPGAPAPGMAPQALSETEQAPLCGDAACRRQIRNTHRSARCPARAARKASRLLEPVGDRRVYFVHTFRALPEPATRTGCSPRPSTAASLCPRSSAARCCPAAACPVQAAVGRRAAGACHDAAKRQG